METGPGGRSGGGACQGPVSAHSTVVSRLSDEGRPGEPGLTSSLQLCVGFACVLLVGDGQRD